MTWTGGASFQGSRLTLEQEVELMSSVEEEEVEPEEE